MRFGFSGDGSREDVVAPRCRRTCAKSSSDSGGRNPTWGEDRIAHELLVKFGIRASPRTVSKYLGSGRPHIGRGDQRWATFVRNHAKAIVACDFFVSVSATFRVFYVFVAMEIGSRRILHINVTDHPTAEWTIQQFREFLHMQLKMSSSANSCAEPKI